MDNSGIIYYDIDLNSFSAEERGELVDKIDVLWSGALWDAKRGYVWRVPTRSSASAADVAAELGISPSLVKRGWF